MIINCLDIESGEGQEISHAYPFTDPQLNFDDQQLLQEIIFSARIHKEANYLFIDGVLRSEVKRMCCRCLFTVEQPIEVPVQLSFSIKGKAEVDITEDIYEALIFAHPLRFLCQEDCKGLCSVCGKNRNSETCDCEYSSEGNVFSQLKKRQKNR